MKKLSLLLFSVLISLNFNILSAQEYDDNDIEPKGIPNISEEVKEEIKTIRANAKTEIAPLKTEIETLIEEHAELLKADNPNYNDISAKIEEISEKRVEIAKIRAQMHIDIKAKLTDEQKEWYNEHVLTPKNKKQGDDKGKKQGKN